MDIIYHDLCTQVTGAVHEDDAGEQAAESRNVAKGHGLYLIPTFASEHECDELTSVAAEYAARVAPPSCDEAHNTPPPGWRLGFAETPKQRLPVAKLAGAAQSLCDTLVRRTIALVESDGRLPALGELLFGSHDVRLADLDIRFSLNEPAVNIYGANGGFDEHEDGHQITILVPLSELAAFEGGGTSFWPTAKDAATFSLSEHDRSVHVVRDTSAAGQIMRPSRGTAMIFTGAVRRHHVAERIKPPPPCSHPSATLHPVFPICILRKMPDRGMVRGFLPLTAQVTHSGVTVTAGTRVVFVASFNLLPWASARVAEPGRLLVGNRPNPQEEARAEAAAEAQVDAAANIPALLAKPPVSVFSAPRGGSIFGNSSSSTVRSSAANAPPSSIFSGGRQGQASKVSMMQALPTDLSIEERVLEMQIEYVLESEEGMLQADSKPKPST